MSNQPNRRILQELVEASSAFLVDSVTILDGGDMPGLDVTDASDIHQCNSCGAFERGRDPRPDEHHDGCQVQRLRCAIAEADALLKQYEPSGPESSEAWCIGCEGGIAAQGGV